MKDEPTFAHVSSLSVSAAECGSRCDKPQCAGKIFPHFRLDFSPSQQVWTGGLEEREGRSQRGGSVCDPWGRGVRSQSCMLERKMIQSTQKGVFGFAYRVAYIFFWGNQKYPPKASVSPPSFSIMLTAQSFGFPALHTITSSNAFWFSLKFVISYIISSAKASISRRFDPLTYQSSSISCIAYYHLDLR